MDKTQVSGKTISSPLQQYKLHLEKAQIEGANKKIDNLTPNEAKRHAAKNREKLNNKG